jgi:hypothetical protein
VFPVRYELGFYAPEDGILYSRSRKNLKSLIIISVGCYKNTRMIVVSLFMVHCIQLLVPRLTDWLQSQII